MENRVLLSVGLTEQENDSLRQLVATEAHVELVAVESIAPALETAGKRPLTCVVSAEDLPDGTGTELLDRIRTLAPNVGCLLCADPDRTPLTDGAEMLGVEFVPRTGDAGNRLRELTRITIQQCVQTSYPVPPDEQERLGALSRYEFDHEELESQLNRLTELAASHFEVPFSSINILEDHALEAVASYGISPDAYSREEVVCTFTITDDGPTIIPDLASDARCAGMNPVQQYDFHFYAGATLRDPDCHALGTFCVYDTRTRAFSEEYRKSLELYAAEAMEWIEQLGRIEADRTADGPAEGIE
jgi:hypothetical protein